MTSTTEFLLPFAGRNHSGATNQNLLCKAGNVYIMDNHRAAMWCWLQEVPEDGVVGLFHIDEHYDTLYSRIDEWKASLPALRGLRIGEYLVPDRIVRNAIQINGLRVKFGVEELWLSESSRLLGHVSC